MGADPGERRRWGLILALLTADEDLWCRVESYLDPPFFAPPALSDVTPYQAMLLELAHRLLDGPF